MAKRGTKRSGGEPSPTAPLKGAIQEGETPENLAFRMVIERLESMERQRILETQATQAALTATTETMRHMQEAIAKEKSETAQAIELLHQQIKSIVESRPDDPQTIAAIGQKLVEDAKKNIANKRKTFLEQIKTMPTGNIENNSDKTIRFIINGVDFYIHPGLNKNMPQTLVEAWEQQQREKEYYRKLDYALQTRGDSNEFQKVAGGLPIWSEELGRVQ